MYRIAITTVLLAIASVASNYGQVAPPPPVIHNPKPAPPPKVVPVAPVDVWGDMPDFEMDMDRVQSEIDRIRPGIHIDTDAAMLELQQQMKTIKPEIARSVAEADRQLQGKLKDLHQNFAFNFNPWGAVMMPRFDERDLRRTRFPATIGAARAPSIGTTTKRRSRTWIVSSPRRARASMEPIIGKRMLKRSLPDRAMP